MEFTPRTPTRRRTASNPPISPSLLSARIIPEEYEHGASNLSDGQVSAAADLIDPSPLAHRAWASAQRARSAVAPALARAFFFDRRSSTVTVDVNLASADALVLTARAAVVSLLAFFVFVLLHLLMPVGLRASYYEHVMGMLALVRQTVPGPRWLTTRPVGWVMDQLLPWCLSSCHAVGQVLGQCACLVEYGDDTRMRVFEAANDAGRHALEGLEDVVG